MINYSIIGIVVLVLLVALYFYFKRNAKDKKELNEKLNADNITTNHYHSGKQ